MYMYVLYVCILEFCAYIESMLEFCACILYILYIYSSEQKDWNNSFKNGNSFITYIALK